MIGPKPPPESADSMRCRGTHACTIPEIANPSTSAHHTSHAIRKALPSPSPIFPTTSLTSRVLLAVPGATPALHLADLEPGQVADVRGGAPQVGMNPLLALGASHADRKLVVGNHLVDVGAVEVGRVSQLAQIEAGRRDAQVAYLHAGLPQHVAHDTHVR